MKFKLTFVIMLLSLSSCNWSNDPEPNELKLDWAAKALVKTERYEDALQKYLEIVEINANRFSTHSNIGVLLSMLQKPEEAEKSLLHALQLSQNIKDNEGIFTVHFNLGVFYGAQKKVSKAIEHYQAALEIRPTSIESKTNIELLIQQQQNQQGQSESKPQDKNNQSSQGDQKQQQNEQEGKQDQKDQQSSQNDQQRQNSPRYKPRPYQGDQLSEGDVKKILGELRNQEQKIRANFDKKEKGKSRDNEKDW